MIDDLKNNLWFNYDASNRLLHMQKSVQTVLSRHICKILVLEEAVLRKILFFSNTILLLISVEVLFHRLCKFFLNF